MAAYVGLISMPRADHDRFAARVRTLAAARPGLEPIRISDSVSLWTDGLERVPLDGRSLVLGTLFRHEGGRVTAFDDREARAVAASGGADLVANYWGSYVALLAENIGGARLIRAPLGALPCYLLESSGGTLFGSSAALLFGLADSRPRITLDAVVRQLAFGNLRTRETCIEGLSELPGGARIAIAPSGRTLDTLWSPWTWAAAERAVVDRDEAARRLGAVARLVVGQAAAGRVLLKLSGGLDSSVIAACLSSARADFASLTLTTDDPGGDERDYARAVARHLGTALHEVRRDPTLFEPGCSPAHGLPRPSVPGFRQVSDAIAAKIAGAIGASAVLDGGGGDNVFCSLQSAAPVADCLLARDGRRDLMRTATSIASIAQVSVFEVLRRAAGRALRPRRDYRWPADRDLLSAAALPLVTAPDHPWLRRPEDILPGKAAHVALITAGQSYVEGLDPEREPPLMSPLLAQPLVELCLSIPSWLWFEQGQNRAVARRAFRGSLPQHILARRTKGTPDSFVAQLYEMHRHEVRVRLLDGLLARHDLLDRSAIERLTDGRPLADRHLHRIMILFDADVWAQGWSA